MGRDRFIEDAALDHTLAQPHGESVFDLFLMYFAYSFLGWCIEVTLKRNRVPPR